MSGEGSEGVIVTSHYSVSEGRLARVAAEYVGDVEQVELIMLYNLMG